MTSDESQFVKPQQDFKEIPYECYCTLRIEECLRLGSHIIIYTF